MPRSICHGNRKARQLRTACSRPDSAFGLYHRTHRALPKDTRTAITNFKDAIQTLAQTELSAIADSEEGADDQKPEILIGSTNRAATAEALKLLNEAGEGKNYIIRYADRKIVILGKNNIALRHAMRHFLDQYIAPSSGATVSFTEEFMVMAAYDSSVTVLPTLTKIDVAFTSNVEANQNRWPTYGRVIELKYNGEQNGTLYATSQWAGENFPVYRSTDGGKKWKLLSKVAEELTPGLIGNWQPHLYELPCQVGDMPAGTLLLSGCSHDPDNAKTMQISIWRSFDLGQTWEQYTIVDTGNGLSDGMYEPFLICDEDGSLGFTGCTPYCEWTPAGGPYGTVIAAGRFGNKEMTEGSDLFVSFDLGKTWKTIPNPLQYDYHQSSDANYAYSFGFFAGADGSIYYINNVFPKNTAQKYKYGNLRFAKILLDSYWSYTEE